MPQCCVRLSVRLSSLSRDSIVAKRHEFGDEIWRQKTRVLGLPVGEEIMPLAFFVLTQYRRVTVRRTDGETDRQTRCDRYYPR